MDASLQTALAALRRGGVVACPTETLMGLLADAHSEAAVARLCALKRRPPGEPIALIAGDAEQAFTLAASVSDDARRLAAEHWPGPLTLVMRAAAGLPAQLVRDGCVGVRVPSPCPALQLCRAFGSPLTATSANLSGEPVCQSAHALREAFGDGLDATVSGTAPGTAPSTVVDVTASEPRVIRQGALQL